MSTPLDDHDSQTNDQSLPTDDHNDHHDPDENVQIHTDNIINLADQSTLEQGYRQDGNDPHSSGNQLLEQAFPNLQELNPNAESIDEYPVDTEVVEVEQTGPVDDVQDDRSTHPLIGGETATTLGQDDGLGIDHPMTGETSDVPNKEDTGKASRARTRKRPAGTLYSNVDVHPIVPNIAGPSSSGPQRSDTPQQSERPSSSALPTYTNKEQLAMLRQFYLENPTPSKSEIIELARVTGRPWGKVKEYFRQRRNKLRGVDEAGLDGMDEPDRATSWLQMSYRLAPSGSTSQLGLYLAYQSRFDPNHKSSPLLGGQDLIRLACATFEGCSLGRDGEGEWILRGMDRKTSEEAANEKGKAGNSVIRSKEVERVTRMEEYLLGMPEPLRASTWLMHNYRPDQSSASVDTTTAQRADNASVSQTDLYASYVARFGGDLTGTNDDEGEDEDGAENETKTAARSMEIDETLTLNTGNRSRSESEAMQQDNLNRLESMEVKSVTLKKSPDVSPSSRLLNPVELINLTKMAFPGCEAVVDDQGRFVIKGLGRREGVGKYKQPAPTRNSDIFPFGLLDIDPSSSDHPFTATIKRKLDALETQAESSQTEAKRRRHNEDDEPNLTSLVAAGEEETTSNHESSLAVTSHTLITAEELEAIARSSREQDQAYGEVLPAADRELVEGLRRFRNSRLGREVRDVCIQQ